MTFTTFCDCSIYKKNIHISLSTPIITIQTSASNYTIKNKNITLITYYFYPLYEKL